MDVSEMKKALRTAVHARLKALTSDDIKIRSIGIERLLLSLPQWKNARRVGIYLSMPNGEASTHSLVEHALESGKEVFVPYLHKNPGVSRTDSENSYKPKRVMNMVSLSSLSDYRDLQRDKWGIPTPSQDSIPNRKHVLGEAVGDPPRRSGLSEKLDLVVVPGVAFDREGRRLGHGRGFYDFFLEEYRLALDADEAPSSVSRFPSLVALALPEQVLPPNEKIPTEAHDRKIDVVVTDKEAIVL